MTKVKLLLDICSIRCTIQTTTKVNQNKAAATKMWVKKKFDSV